MNRKITITLLLSQSLLSAALILSFTVGSIAAVDLAGGNRAVTGVPSTVSLIASALVAAPVGLLMDRTGRRLGLTLGHGFGVVGALLAGWAVVAGSLFLFLAGMACLGLARGAVEQGRYAAAEASSPDKRGRAISLVVMGGTVGSITGPSLLAFAGLIAASVGLPADAGPWVVAAVLFGVAIVLLSAFLHPDPQQLGRQLAAQRHDPLTEPRPLRAIFAEPHTQLALMAMAFGQVAMVVVMTITPVHMDENQHALNTISLVIMAHTLGMFGFSFLTGWLADHIGRLPTIAGGSIMLVMACILAPFSIETPWLAMSLFLLGLGWNFCFVAGSTLLDDALTQSEKGRAQGTVDTLVKLASGLGTLLSGVVFSIIGFSWTSWLTLIIGLMPLLAILILSRRQPIFAS